MKIPRISNITEERFIADYIVANKPVIVTDGMENWDMEKFTPKYLTDTFGDMKVQIYNDLFDLLTIEPLEQYINTNFFRTEEEGLSDRYMRWYTKLKDIEYYWSDQVFDALKDFWNHPDFIPQTSLAVPINSGEAKRNINENHYPYKGLFISGKGSRTRLHKDPFTSNAILCQFYGKKKMYLYSPDKELSVMSNGEFVDIQKPDLSKFPNFPNVVHDYEDILSPGEIVFFPSGWFHDVTCQSDSISITWNFIHALQVKKLCKHIALNPEDDQLEVVRFFLKEEIEGHIDVREMIRFFRNKHKTN